MPDDLSGLEDEFQERLADFEWEEWEEVMSPGNRAIDDILMYFDVIDVNEQEDVRLPEHDLSWFGKRVHKDRRWEVRPRFRPQHLSCGDEGCGCGMGARFVNCFTNTTSYSQKFNPGLCDVCGELCRCLDSISWFREEKPQDPGRMFWR